ncbi:allene oxide cyclase barrel-like domain-containing protein [Saccharothrix hoggarensis]|uniref:Allene oxide cyclase barrel-like domain-containing protein n=1 Tax=Saccharothrix hoggarensis TaxID=913853 RepID=A0ABW3QZK7_9PSEU
MQVRPWLVLALAGGLLGADHVRTDEATVEVVAKRGLMSAPAAPAVGGGFVSGGDLFAADGTTRVGEGHSHCGVVKVTVDVPPAVTTHCTSTFRLADGELHLSGMRTYKSIAAGFGDATMAITGGTGAYANARGEGKAVRSDSADVAYEFTFTITDG